MKNLLFLLLLCVSSLFALSGEEVFKSKCVLCHVKSMDISDLNEEIKAPPMNMIALRLKSAITTKKEFVAFVKDYLLHPSKEKGYCMQTAYERFGVMPAVGTMLTKEEITIIAVWLYEEFSQEKEIQDTMKCGAGKCGSGKCGGSNMRCGTSKCGSQ